MDLRFQERTSVRTEIFGEKEENEGRGRKNGHTAVWQILWDVVEGWWCFHCWHQHKFSWRGSPCPAWAQHWETGEEILRAAREWNQRARAPGPLTHWTPRWPHDSLLFSHTQSYMHRHTHTHTHTSRDLQQRTVRSAKKQIRSHFQEHLGSMLVTLCLRCLIYLRAVRLFLPSDKRCLSLCGSWGWRTLACIRTVRRSVADQRFNEPCLRSLIKNLTDAHMLARAGSARVIPGAYAHACMQTHAARVNDDVISPDILEMSGSGDMLHVICSLRVRMCACVSALCLRSCWRLYNEHDGHSVLCHSE